MTKQNKLTASQQRGAIRAVFADFLEDDGQTHQLLDFCNHCRINLGRVGSGQQELVNAILTHYQIGARRFDLDRVAQDLATYPPVARRIEEIRARYVAK